MSDNLIGTTNELIISYDKKFNENYNKLVNIDGSIQNKEQLIIKHNEVIMHKEKNILILQYLIFLLIIICIINFLYIRKIINLNNFIGITLFMIIVFAIIIYYSVLNHYNVYNVSRKIQNLQVKMQSYAQKILKDTVPGYTCPVKCDTKKNDTEEEIHIPVHIKAPGDTLNINPQSNVWKLGNIPYNTEGINTTSDKNPMLYDSGDEPKPSFGTTYQKSTYYQCDWLGGGTRGSEGLPLGGPTSGKPFSTIPCSYKPNMIQKGKYICKTDPNDGIPPDEDLNTYKVSNSFTTNCDSIS